MGRGRERNQLSFAPTTRSQTSMTTRRALIDRYTTSTDDTTTLKDSPIALADLSPHHSTRPQSTSESPSRVLSTRRDNHKMLSSMFTAQKASYVPCTYVKLGLFADPPFVLPYSLFKTLPITTVHTRSRVRLYVKRLRTNFRVFLTNVEDFRFSSVDFSRILPHRFKNYDRAYR